MTEVKAPKNGYLYVYLSNESATPVYFDDFSVSHNRSALIGEDHYYSFGLRIAAISSKAVATSLNAKLPAYGYQGAFAEEVTDFELNYNEFELRTYDPQIGRWTGIDPYDEFASPYVGMGNDPINLNDPTGGFTGLLAGATQLGKSAFMAVAGAMVGGGVAAIAGGDENAILKGAAAGAVLGLGGSFMGGSTLQLTTQAGSVLAVSGSLDVSIKITAPNNKGNVILWLNYEKQIIASKFMSSNSTFDVVEVTDVTKAYEAISKYLTTNKTGLNNVVVWSHGNVDQIEAGNTGGNLAGKDDAANYLASGTTNNTTNTSFFKNMAAIASVMKPQGNLLFVACNAGGDSGGLGEFLGKMAAKAGASSINIYLNKDETLFREKRMWCYPEVPIVQFQRMINFNKPLNFQKYNRQLKGWSKVTGSGNAEDVKGSLIISSRDIKTPFKFRKF